MYKKLFYEYIYFKKKLLNVVKYMLNTYIC